MNKGGMNLHFLNGHRKNFQGARGVQYDDKFKSCIEITEWSYANSLHQLLDADITTHKDAYNLHQKMYLQSSNAVALEFHLNSFNSNTVEGYEVLVIEGDDASRIMAEKFLEVVKKYFPLRRNRGIKILSSNDRGYNNILRLKQYYPIAIITELFFLSNPNDWMMREHAANIINEFNSIVKQFNMEK